MKVKKLVTYLIVVCFLCMLTSSKVNAEEELNINGISYGELLKKIDYNEYQSLSNETRNYFDSVKASELLNEDNNDNTAEFNSLERSILFETHFVLNLAQINRSGDYLYYGGSVTCQSFTAKKISIQAYLIRKTDGKIMANSSGSKTSVKQYGILKKKSLTKSGTLYYAKSVATVTAPDTYVPSQRVITHSSSNIE